MSSVMVILKLCDLITHLYGFSEPSSEHTVSHFADHKEHGYVGEMGIVLQIYDRFMESVSCKSASLLSRDTVLLYNKDD